MVILKNNMKNKNKDKDRWISGLRAPCEGTFSKQNKRTLIWNRSRTNHLNFYMLSPSTLGAYWFLNPSATSV